MTLCERVFPQCAKLQLEPISEATAPPSQKLLEMEGILQTPAKSGQFQSEVFVSSLGDQTHLSPDVERLTTVCTPFVKEEWNWCFPQGT